MGTEVKRALASIRKIESVTKHPNADTLDLLKIGGWQVVSKHGNFKDGDLCVFFEIDAFVPVTGVFAFMEKNKITYEGREGARIKTIRLRKELSQGLALPLHEFHKELVCEDKTDKQLIGLDITDILGIIKWEKMTAEERAKLGGATLGYFPTFIPKTDQERIQNIWGGFGPSTELLFNEYEHPETKEIIKVERHHRYFTDQLFEVSVKLDGSSMTIYRRDDHYGVCSRNLELAESDGNAFWQTSRRLKLREKLIKLGRNYAIQGELVGPGIQGNNDRLGAIDLYVYDIWDIDAGCYLNSYQRRGVISLLNTDLAIEYGNDQIIHNVPIIGYFQLTDNDGKQNLSTIEAILKFAEGGSLNPAVQREGIVFKSITNPGFSFKAISNKYLESEK